MHILQYMHVLLALRMLRVQQVGVTLGHWLRSGNCLSYVMTNDYTAYACGILTSDQVDAFAAANCMPVDNF